MSALVKFHAWLVKSLSGLNVPKAKETWEDGYRQGYRNALADALEELEDLEWDAGEEVE